MVDKFNHQLELIFAAQMGPTHGCNFSSDVPVNEASVALSFSRVENTQMCLK